MFSAPKTLPIILVVLLLSNTASAAIYWCTDANGKKTASDHGCQAGDEKRKVQSKASVLEQSEAVVNDQSEGENSPSSRSESAKIDPVGALAHAKQLIETGGTGGMVEAQSYMDNINSQVAAQNCSTNNDQQSKIRLEQTDLNAARAYANRQLETGGIGGAMVARKYTDMINGLVAAQNCSLGDYQQQREMKKMGKELQSIKSQQIIDNTMAPYK